MERLRMDVLDLSEKKGQEGNDSLSSLQFISDSHTTNPITQFILLTLFTTSKIYTAYNLLHNRFQVTTELIKLLNKPLSFQKLPAVVIRNY